MSSPIKWIKDNENAYATCPKCGHYLAYYGSYRKIHILVCKKCGKVFTRKTPPRELKRRALNNWKW